jgi:hypothetical protein
MPFLAFVHADEPGEPAGRGDERSPWEPNWRLWRWAAIALVVAFAASHATGAVQALLVFVVFGIGVRAIGEVLTWGDGLSEWRQ